LALLATISRHACFGGVLGYYQHPSQTNHCDMRFAVYVPPQAARGPVPVVYYLAGLTCTEETFVTKAGALEHASRMGLMLVAPDTSPRAPLAGDRESWDFGIAAGFYLDATQAPWASHYRMYSYVVDELPGIIAGSFPADISRSGIMGHSMGGHGALTIALRNPARFKAVSAFAPIASPMRCPWGEKALGGYLGPDRAVWRDYDATALIEDGARVPDILVDQGTADGFLENQLKPELLEAACTRAGIPLTLRRQEGYDHSYFFIASFVEDHLRWHAARMKV
jgi:S-formylglutathione hydrolase